MRSAQQAALLTALVTGAAGLVAGRQVRHPRRVLPPAVLVPGTAPEVTVPEVTAPEVTVPQQRVSPLAALGLLSDEPELTADEDALLAALDWRASA